LQQLILLSTSHEVIFSVCYNQQVLSDHKMVAQITCLMQALYKHYLLADGFNWQVYLIPTGVLLPEPGHLVFKIV